MTTDGHEAAFFIKYKVGERSAPVSATIIDLIQFWGLGRVCWSVNTNAQLQTGSSISIYGKAGGGGKNCRCVGSNRRHLESWAFTAGTLTWKYVVPVVEPNNQASCSFNSPSAHGCHRA
jgi:hypothetical protein